MIGRFLVALSSDNVMIGFASIADDSPAALDALAAELMEATGSGRDRAAARIAYEIHGREVWRKDAAALGFALPGAAFDRPPARRVVMRRRSA